MTKLEALKSTYPGALAWQFGDSPELADELIQLVLSGIKTATCRSRASFQREYERGESELASKEGEGDLSLAYWRGP